MGLKCVLLVSGWLALQVWYWVAYRTVTLADARMRQLSEVEAKEWRPWLRMDRGYGGAWWRPLLGATILFPVKALSILVLALLQTVVVFMCLPFTRRPRAPQLAAERSPARLSSRVYSHLTSGISLTQQESNWCRGVLRRLVTALSWLELMCMGVGRVEEYEVLNTHYDFPLQDAPKHVRYRRIYRDEYAAEPKNYVSNHVSYVDIILFIALLFPSFCSKASVAKWPLVGDSAKALDCLFIKRDSEEDRRKVLEEIRRRQSTIWQAEIMTVGRDQDHLRGELRRHLELYRSISGSDDDCSFETSPLMVFPEGTTSNGRFLLPFKRGAFAGLKPVSPVLLVYDCPFYNMSYEVVPIVWLFPILCGCVSPATVKVFWMREIIPSVEMVTQQAVAAYTQLVRSCMAKTLVAVSGYFSPDELSAEDLEHTWGGSIQSKKACIKKLFL